MSKSRKNSGSLFAAILCVLLGGAFVCFVGILYEAGVVDFKFESSSGGGEPIDFRWSITRMSEKSWFNPGESLMTFDIVEADLGGDVYKGAFMTFDDE